MPRLLRKYTRKLLIPKKIKRVSPQEYAKFLKSIRPERYNKDCVLTIAYKNYQFITRQSNNQFISYNEFYNHFKDTEKLNMLMGMWEESGYNAKLMPVLCLIDKRGKRDITNMVFRNKSVPPRRQFGVASYYERKAVYNNPLEILHQLNTASKNKTDILEFDGVLVKSSSLRYKIFEHNLSCVKCGIEGKFLALERAKSQDCKYWHFNLYGYDENGHEVMLTKDHIMPKSKGGKNRLENMQTMCSYCNSLKGDKIETKELVSYGIQQ
jgi:5-methylcytosine-specific restriction endonuclease McrA